MTGRAALSRPARVLVAAVAAALLALLVRLPARSLPIEGDAVAYGALARSIAWGDGYAIDGVAHDRYPPGWPAVIAVPLALGASVTSAVRSTAWGLGALAAALLVILGARWCKVASLGLLAVLAAAHPVFAMFAGGLVPGSEALALTLVLAAVLLAESGRRVALGIALAFAGALPLVRYDAAPFALAAFALAWWRSRASAHPSRVRIAAAALTLLPAAAWLVRTWIVSGAPLGTGYEGHGLSLARLAKNALVLAAVVVPASGLLLLLPFVPRGVAALWRAAERRGVARAALLAAAVHVVVVVLFAGPTGAGEGALRFSSGTLRFGLLAVPFVLVAALQRLGGESATVQRVVGLALGVTAVALGVHGVSGGLQRALPVGPLAAARLHALAQAYDAAVAEAGPADWIGVDLYPRVNEGVEVFLGDRAPSRRTGVLVRARVGVPRPGLFPRPPVLPLEEDLPARGQIVLVTDVPREGVVFTGDRLDLGVGGQGIFHRALLRDVDAGRAGAYRIDSVRRPGR